MAEQLRDRAPVLSRLDLAVIVDFVFNHMMWGQTLRERTRLLPFWQFAGPSGAQFLYGPHLFLPEAKLNKRRLFSILASPHQETIWGPRPDFSKPEA